MNATQQNRQDADIAAIRDVFADLSDTWARADAAGYAALFTPDAQYTTNFGLTLTGRVAIEEGHRRLFDSPHRSEESVLLFGEEPQIRLVRPDVAIVLIGGGTRRQRRFFTPEQRTVHAHLRDAARTRRLAYQHVPKHPAYTNSRMIQSQQDIQ
jgi:uncharacterized protein (TIGR02246 family)